MKAKQMLVIGLTLLGLLIIREASAFYDPTIGRWISRDPLGESGGLNLASFSADDPVNRIDPYGLEDLKFASEGITQVDGRWLGYDHEASSSGKKNSPDAWIWQFARVRYCPNGLCNSGDPAEDQQNSYIKAKAMNKGKCTLLVSCFCTVTWAVGNGGPIPMKAVVVNGNVLGTSISEAYKSYQVGDGRGTGSAVAGGSGSLGVGQSFFLQPGGERELYYLTDINAVGPNPDSYFYESLKGTCSCLSKIADSEFTK